MCEGGKPKFITFRLYENVPRWKVAIAAIVLFAVAWFAWESISRVIALSYIPKIDVVDSDGVIPQASTFSCAPAALAMFFKDEGIETSQWEIAKIAGTNMSGTTDRGIRKAVVHFGYKATIKRMDYQDIRKYGKPLIIKDRFKETVHITYVKPINNVMLRAVEILDPIDGYFRVREQGFYDFFGDPGSKVKCFLIEKVG